VEEAKSMVLDLKENGMKLLTMTGGEPLCRKDFVLELGSFLNDNSVRYRVFTNGILFDEELASKLKERGVSEIQVSIDGLEETHDAFRGMKGAFKRAIKAIRAAEGEGIKTAARYKHKPTSAGRPHWLIFDRSVCANHLVRDHRCLQVANDAQMGLSSSCLKVAVVFAMSPSRIS